MAKWGLAIAICVSLAAAIACDAMRPSPPAANLSGEWIGSVGPSGDTPMSFTVSREQRVTSLTIEHTLDRCKVTAAFTNLQLTIETHYFGSRSELPGFFLGSAPPPNMIEVRGEFRTKTHANGSVSFVNYGGCGSGATTWRALRR